MKNIGYIQGRLSPIIDGKIQAFPKKHWREEFKIGASRSFQLIEWTLDHEDLFKNPFITDEGQKEIAQLKGEYGVSIPSLTGDFFMQAPFFKASSTEEKTKLIEELKVVIKSCKKNDTKYLVIPLVDNASLENDEQESECVSTLIELIPLLSESNVIIVFESDKAPNALKEFIATFPAEHFGINYDSGNSAALGYNVLEEFECYQERILNIHIKDRVLHGTTVPLGTGNTRFEDLAGAIKSSGYKGNYILQTARAEDTQHLEALVKYRNFFMELFE